MSAAAMASLLIGDSPPMRRLRALIAKIAPAKVPVLIQGPTGSGKELVAQAIHLASGRTGRLVAVNVCAISVSMFEATLFGHTRGAFTGATADAPGLLIEADQGTLFLDEIGPLTLEAQTKLLRAIEAREFRPIGARHDRRSDFRVVAATNDDLSQRVEDGTFRADLVFRLRGVLVEVPPLRERPEDIGPLARHFITTCTPAVKAELTDSALRALMEYDWPGNVRELRHVIHSAVVLADGRMVTGADIRSLVRTGMRSIAESVDSAARNELYELLRQHEWDTALVAQTLGVHRVTVYRRMARLGVTIPPEHRGRRNRATRLNARSHLHTVAANLSIRAAVDAKMAGED